MGSIGAAALLAKVAFLSLLGWGWATGELRLRAVTLFLLLGSVAWLGLPLIPGGADFATTALALIDVGLVFTIFKGDVRIT